MSDKASGPNAQQRAELEASQQAGPESTAATDLNILFVPTDPGSNFSRINLSQGGQLEITLESLNDHRPNVTVHQPGGKVENVPLGTSTYAVKLNSFISFPSDSKANPFKLGWRFL